MMKLCLVQGVLPILAILAVVVVGAPKFARKNHFLSGVCSPDDVMIYTDDTRIENSGPSILNATLEVSAPKFKRCKSKKNDVYS